MNGLEKIFEGLLGGGIAGGIIAGVITFIIRAWIKGVLADNMTLRKELGDLKDNRLHKLESELDEHIAADKSTALMGELKHVINNISKLSTELEKHISDDNSKAVMTELKHIVGNLSKIADKVDRIGVDTASQQAQIEAANHYVKNLDTSFQRHKEATHHA